MRKKILATAVVFIAGLLVFKYYRASRPVVEVVTGAVTRMKKLNAVKKGERWRNTTVLFLRIIPAKTERE